MNSVKLEMEGAVEGHSGGSGEEGSSEGKAPSDFLAECLSACLRRRYGAALRYCRLILRHEPRHRAARALLPTLAARAPPPRPPPAPSAHSARHVPCDSPHTNHTTPRDEIVGNVGDSSSSTTDSSHSVDGADRSRSESHRLERSRSESRSEDAASEYGSELELESEDDLLEDVDTYTSTSASSSHEGTDSSGCGGGGGAVCDDNGNCTASDVRNDNASPPAPGATSLPPAPSRDHWQRDTRPIALDNDPRPIKDYQLRKSCAH